MRDLTALDDFRQRTPFVLDQFGDYGDDKSGAFLIPVPGQSTVLKVLASGHDGWDHISVSVNGQGRTPTWAEMEHAKRLFFKKDELAWEYHMNPDDHLSIHPYVLHIWRKHDFEMPLPPKFFV
jgi:hypothetical protein